MPATWQWAEVKEEVGEQILNILSRRLAVKERRGSRLKLEEEVGSRRVFSFSFLFYEDTRKTSMFIVREERTQKILGCKHVVS